MHQHARTLLYLLLGESTLLRNVSFVKYGVISGRNIGNAGLIHLYCGFIVSLKLAATLVRLANLRVAPSLRYGPKCYQVQTDLFPPLNLCPCSREDFQRIPELAINPLGDRIINAFFPEG